MDHPSDPFDDVLLTYSQLREQSQKPPQEKTLEEIEQEERARERQRQIQEEIDEFNALREWDDRVRLVESLRAQVQVIFWRGIVDIDRYRQTPSPIDWNPASESPDRGLVIQEMWNRRTTRAPLDIATAETESDSANDSVLRLTRNPPSRSSRPTYSPAELPVFLMDFPEADDSGSDGLSDGEPPSAPIIGPTRWLNDSISEPELNADEAASSSSDSSLGTPGTMVFEMEMDEPAAATETNEEAISDDSSDSDIDVGIDKGRPRELGPYDTPPRQPIAIRARNRSAQDMAELDMEALLDDVRGFSIGFHLNVFPWLVMRRIRRMRETALPGSFEHLLMHMFDDIRHVTVFQADVRRTGIQSYMQARHGGASHDDALADDSSQADISLDPGPSSLRPAIVAVLGEGASEDSSTAFFSQELGALRLMVAPIRDREARFAWITSRTDQLREQFQASKVLIANFKRRLVRSLRQSETWTIRHPKSNLPFHEGQARSLSLRQYRLDACGAALCWETNKPDDVEPQGRLSGQMGRLSPHGPALAQPVHVTPDVQFSIAQGNEFTNVADVQRYTVELFTLLVQIAQWLALARGHAAVHLFCDICRLFSLSGVDLSDAVQTDFCEHLLAMEAWSDQAARPDPLSAGYAAESADSGLVGAVGYGNNQLGKVLMEVESLFHRVGDDRCRSVRGVGRA